MLTNRQHWLEQRSWKNPDHSKMMAAIGVILNLEGAKINYKTSVYPEGF